MDGCFMATPPTTNSRPLRQIQTAASDLVANGQADEAIELVIAALEAVLRHNTELELLIRKLKAQVAGKSRSEKIDPAQLSLLLSLLEPDDDNEPDLEQEELADAALDKEIEQAETERVAEVGPKPVRRRCKALKTEGLEVRHTHLPIPPEMKDWEVIGDKTVERLRYSPSHFYMELIHQPVLKDPELSEAGMENLTTVPAPPSLVPHGMPGADVLAMLVVCKYVDHLPLHRLHRRFLREQGVDLPVSTLADWVMWVGKALQRLVPLLLLRVLDSFMVQTDGTGMRVIDSATVGLHRGTFYAYVGHAGGRGSPHDVVFVYTPTGKADAGPWAVLKKREGYLQADASNSFDRLYNGKVATAIEVGCHFHARRDFKACDTDPRAGYPLQLVRRLYRLESLADAKGMDAAQRLRMRHERSAPVMKKLHRTMLTLVRDGIPSDPLRQAAQYYLNHWAALSRFLEDGRIELDNSRVEREFRVVRLGEHNYLFAGSDEAAERMGAILSVLGSAKSHGLDPYTYLCDILQALAYPMTAEAVAELLPHRYKARLEAAASETAPLSVKPL